MNNEHRLSFPSVISQTKPTPKPGFQEPKQMKQALVVYLVIIRPCGVSQTSRQVIFVQLFFIEDTPRLGQSLGFEVAIAIFRIMERHGVFISSETREMSSFWKLAPTFLKFAADLKEHALPRYEHSDR
jgi:hypothetical protein